MGGCDLCGKEPVVGICDVEGARVNVCASCSGFGKIIRRFDQPPHPDPWTVRRARARPASPAIEPQVHPDLAKILRKARERAGKTQEEFSALLGIKLSQYHHFESGSGVPDIETARRMERSIGTALVVRIREEGTSGSAGSAPAGSGVTLGDILKRSSR